MATAMAKTSPPRANELELSLFGPGIGECLVVHLGTGNWMVVDSCLNDTRESSIALEYLASIQVDVASQVKLIVVTHWHDDHIRGVSQLVRFAGSARFVCSGALRSEEFLSLIAADEEIKLVEHTSGVSEFANVLKFLQERAGSRFPVGPDHWACEGTLLFSDTTQGVEVHALSPSSQTITDSKGELAGLIPSLGEAIRRFPSVGANDLSVALLVRTNGLNLLLGADLEAGRNERTGWRGVLRSQVRPQVSSSAFKVAHHGSTNADLIDIWKYLVVANPHALLTPYSRGHAPLPTPGDVIRIKSKTNHAYCTAWPPTTSPPRRRGVDKTINEVTRSRAAVRNRPGQIRVRAPINGGFDDITVELFDGARRL